MIKYVFKRQQGAALDLAFNWIMYYYWPTVTNLDDNYINLILKRVHCLMTYFKINSHTSVSLNLILNYLQSGT